MSRSYKKNMGTTMCYCKNIKDDRTIYHRLERAKSKSQLKHIINNPEDEAAQDKVIKEKIDYGIVWADTWNWSSDGGSFLMYTDSELRKHIEDKIKHINDTWKDYLRYINHTGDYLDNVMNATCKLAKKVLKSPEQLAEFMSANRERIIEIIKKTEFGK